MVDPENLARHELIGLDVQILKSKNKSMEGLNGVVVDESRQTLTIKTSKGEKKIPKDICVFVFKLPDGKKVKVDGELLVSRPEDRVKKKFKKW